MAMPSVFTGVFKSQRGSMLVHSLLANVMVLTIAFSIFTYLNDQLISNNTDLVKRRLALVNNKIVAAVEHTVAWEKSQNHPLNASTFSCLANNSCGSDWRYFNLYSSNDEILIESTGTGYTMGGEKCAGFSATSESIQCPFFYRIKWAPDCVSCKQSVRVATELTLSPLSGVILKTDNYLVDFIRGKIEGTLASNCTAMGGYLDPHNKANCILPITGIAECPAGTFLNGTDANGEKVCKPIKAVFQACPNGVATINAKGELACN